MNLKISKIALALALFSLSANCLAASKEEKQAKVRKSADAAAKAGKAGGAYSGAVEVAPGVWVYQMTKNGLALQLTLQGTKYYKDKDLND